MSLLIIPPKPHWDRQNEVEHREQVARDQATNYKKSGDLIVPLGKKLGFTSPTGAEITFSVDAAGNFTFVIDVHTATSLASIDYVNQVVADPSLAFASAIAEVTAAFTAADAIVAASVTTEQTARASADSSLASSIASLSSTVTSNLSTVNASISSEASTRASADSAEASTRAAADATLTSGLSTANANISTNTSAIATESTARAGADTTLTAKITSGIQAFGPSDFTAEGLYWFGGFGGSPTSVADPSGVTYVDVANVGHVMQATTFPLFLQPKQPIKPTIGRKYRMTVEARVSVNPSSGTLSCGIFIANGMDTAFAHGNPSGTAGSVPAGAISSLGPIVVADGWQTFVIEFHATTLGTYDAYWRPRFDSNLSGGGSGGTMQYRKFLLEDITDIVATNASVSNIAEAYATNSSSTARLLWEVVAGTNVAQIIQSAASGYSDGTWNGSVIKLVADMLQLVAKNIDFGTNTHFEDTYGTIYTVAGSYRVRILGAFPGSGALLLWYGLNSVTLNSETTANSIFHIDTAGTLGGSGLPSASVFDAYLDPGSTTEADAAGAGSQTFGTATITTAFGDAPYSYEWVVKAGSSPTGSPVINSPSSASTTITFASNPGPGSFFLAFYDVRVTDNSGRLKIVTVGFALNGT